jgi:hypothetical protein
MGPLASGTEHVRRSLVKLKDVELGPADPPEPGIAVQIWKNRLSRGSAAYSSSKYSIHPLEDIRMKEKGG